MEAVIRQSKKAYYGNEEPVLEDAEWDSLGADAEERRADAVPLPVTLPSEAKATDLSRFVARTRAAAYVVSDKLDGNAALVADGRLFIKSGHAVGVDVSWLLDSVPSGTVRGELVVSRSNFATAAFAGFRNPRSAVNGLLHRGASARRATDPALWKMIEFVAHELLEEDAPEQVAERMAVLSARGFAVVDSAVASPEQVSDVEWLKSFLARRKADSKYSIDGVVVRPDRFRVTLRESAHTNPNSVSFKYGDRVGVTEVLRVTYRATRTGKSFPTVHLRPVTIDGRTISKVSGKSTAFVCEHGVGKGAVVSIAVCGDVIPNIHRVIVPAKEVSKAPVTTDPWPEKLLFLVRGLGIKGFGRAAISRIAAEHKDFDSALFGDELLPHVSELRSSIDIAALLALLSVPGAGPVQCEKAVLTGDFSRFAGLPAKTISFLAKKDARYRAWAREH